MSDDLLETIDLIYSAATDPGAWNPVLRRLADMTGCIAGGLTIEDPVRGSGRPLTFFGFDPLHVQHCFDHYLPMNPLFAIENRMRPGFVVTNGMVVDERIFRRSEFYDGWARPQGLCSPLSLVLHREAGRYMPLTLVRPDGAGDASNEDLSLLKALSPHLIRAMDIGIALNRLDVLRSPDWGSLDHLHVGIILLDEQDRMIQMNPVAEGLVRDGIIDVRQRQICGRSDPLDSAIKQVLAERRAKDGLIACETFVRHQGDLHIKISAISIDADRAGFDHIGSASLLLFRFIDDPRSTNIQSFSKQFDLTEREASLLGLLVFEGLSLSDCATRLSIRLTTVKTHLQKIFDKTHTQRQTQLIAKFFSKMN